MRPPLLPPIQTTPTTHHVGVVEAHGHDGLAQKVLAVGRRGGWAQHAHGNLVGLEGRRIGGAAGLVVIVEVAGGGQVHLAKLCGIESRGTKVCHDVWVVSTRECITDLPEPNGLHCCQRLAVNVLLQQLGINVRLGHAALHLRGGMLWDEKFGSNPPPLPNPNQLTASSSGSKGSLSELDSSSAFSRAWWIFCKELWRDGGGGKDGEMLR